MSVHGLLPNAPLVYVLGSIGYTPLMNIDKDIGALQDALRKEYPLFKLVEVKSISLHMNETPDQNSIVTTVDKQYNLTSIDHAWTISIENEKVIFHTRRYTRFKDFSDRFRHVLDAIHRTLNIGYTVYEGLRYIDHIVPSEGELLSQYLAQGMTIGQIDGIEGRQLDGFAGASFDTKIGAMAIRCWINPQHVFPPDLVPFLSVTRELPDRPQGEFAILDTDHGSSHEPLSFDIDNVLKNLDSLHVGCRQAFQGLVTKHAFSVWGKQ